MKLTERQVDLARKILLAKATERKNVLLEVVGDCERSRFNDVPELARDYVDLIAVSDALLEAR